MHKTIYIDIDEEITSVIDRIRKEGAPDIFMVVPKNAMLCQGLLNLKLLKKEAQRLGKNIMMVTNDKHAKKVIERAGLTISTKPLPEPEEQRNHTVNDLAEKAAIEAAEKLQHLKLEPAAHEEPLTCEIRDIGTASFYDHEAAKDLKELLDDGETTAVPLPQSKSTAWPNDASRVDTKPAYSPAASTGQIPAADRSSQPAGFASKPVFQNFQSDRTGSMSPSTAYPKPSPSSSPMPSSTPQSTLPSTPAYNVNPSGHQAAASSNPQVFSKSPFSRERSVRDSVSVPSSIPAAPITPGPSPISHSLATPFSSASQAAGIRTMPRPSIDVMSPRPSQPVPSRPSGNYSERPSDPQPKSVPVTDSNPAAKIGGGNGTGKDNQVPVSHALPRTGAWNSKEAEEFFSGGYTPSKDESGKEEKQKEKEDQKTGSKIWRILLAVVAVFVGLGTAAGWIYWKYPLVSITVHPNQKTVDFPIELKASANRSEIDIAAREIPAKLETIEVTKTMEFSASGEKYTSDSGKARGTVTIINHYSSSPQTLVATTRVLSKEKKLFRLENQVIVPGIEGDTPGKVDVEVVADEPGDDYNIGPSTFTIEGFKGSPKYEKFEVVSTASMSSGSASSGNNKVKTVTAKDIESARQQSMDTLDQELEKETKTKISQGYTAQLDTAEKEIVKSSSTHKEGSITEKFSYSVTEKVKVLVFSTEDVKHIVDDQVRTAKESGYELVSLSDVTYEKSTVDKDRSAVTLQLSAKGTFAADIDAENLKRGVVGKKEDEIKEFLSHYEEINKVEIKFTPAWLTAVPVAERKVQVKLAE